MKEGKDVTIFCTGAIVSNCLKAAQLLENNKVSCKVVNMHTIKPIDVNAIKNSCNSKMIVSVEEHNVIGGLGSAISEYKSTLLNSPKQLFIGIQDSYSKGGSYEFLLNKHGLTPDQISEKILKNVWVI